MADRECYGYPFVDHQRLPVSQNLRDELDSLAHSYDSAVDWEDPAGEWLWSQAELYRFNTAVRATVARLREELPSGWRVTDHFEPLQLRSASSD
ncbi:hypothetical protein [Agromyces sp. CCNWLW203]|uniref:hypothetical protein n=1 Tax=Agromyces sp. CCNWLW203 TaxID=3112842 RepID=UPI002F96C63C